jgi:multidrug efflux pump subunit AcrA (membrane-fusion protein)
MTIALIFLCATVCLTTGVAWHFFTNARQLRDRFAGITDIEKEQLYAAQKLEALKQERELAVKENDDRRSKLKAEYDEALATYKRLKQEVQLLEENLEDISFGVYKPHFAFGAPDEYKAALVAVRDKARAAIKEGQAAVCPRSWSVEGDAREGAKMVKKNIKLMLRAFNGECEGALADVSWNNVTRMEERIRKAFEAINTLGEVLLISITQSYLQLKLDELHLAFEYEQKKYQEREEQRRIREEMREEERAAREIEQAREDAEREEARFQKALEKAREEAAKATGMQLQKLTDQISSFEAKLDEARKKKERAISRAEITKSGFVYVISNIGSFGERVVKIGMTRRMEPMERVYELGSASVPFPFDVHAMIFTDNAPDLENALHQQFESHRINLANPRKEFYRGIELDEIESFVHARGCSAQFIKEAESREYRETLAQTNQSGAAPEVSTQEFSEVLFK